MQLHVVVGAGRGWHRGRTAATAGVVAATFASCRGGCCAANSRTGATLDAMAAARRPPPCYQHRFQLPALSSHYRRRRNAGHVAGEAIDTGVVCEEPQPWYKLKFLVAPMPWDTGIELGINGSSGTSESFSIRTGGYIKRDRGSRSST